VTVADGGQTGLKAFNKKTYSTPNLPAIPQVAPAFVLENVKW